MAANASKIRPVGTRFLALLLVIAAAFACARRDTDPVLPASDDVVVEHVPAGLSGASGPLSLEQALDKARRALDEARARSDPRYLGLAESALGPWWDLPDPPPAVLVLRATIRQHRHDFEGALADLGAALSRDPRDAQAWLTRGVVLLVRARPAEARASCEAAARLGAGLAGAACLASVDGISGRAEEARRTLAHALAAARRATAAERLWSLTVLAEISVRLGDDPAADTYFGAALALNRSDPYLLASDADYLLERGRGREVIGLLRGQEHVDALLLRLARAEGTAERVADLRERLAAVPRVHLREEAALALYLLHDPARALGLAREDWAQQREPTDAALLLEAAIAAQDPAAARPVLDWMAETGIEDRRLRALAARLAR